MHFATTTREFFYSFDGCLVLLAHVQGCEGKEMGDYTEMKKNFGQKAMSYRLSHLLPTSKTFQTISNLSRMMNWQTRKCENPKPLVFSS